MNYTIQNILSSVAKYLRKTFQDENEKPLYPVYTSPTANTAFPCFFVFPMNPTFSDVIDDRSIRDIPLDIVFVQQRNIPDANDQLYSIAETIEETIDLLPYTDGEDTVPLHTYDRSWSIEDQELHYKITLRQRVSLPRSETLMQTMEDANVEVKRAEV